MVQRTMFGPPKVRFDSVRDASVLEMVPLLVLAVAVIAVGVYPSMISDVFARGIQPVIESLQNPGLLALR